MSQSTYQTSPSEKKRTDKQNKALHKYFSELAEELNDHGLDMRATLKEEIEIPWTAESIKEYLWRPVMVKQLNKYSTTELTTKDIDRVFDTISRHLADRFGFVVNFPSIETLLEKHLKEEENNGRQKKDARGKDGKSPK